MWFKKTKNSCNFQFSVGFWYCLFQNKSSFWIYLPFVLSQISLVLQKEFPLVHHSLVWQFPYHVVKQGNFVQLLNWESKNFIIEIGFYHFHTFFFNWSHSSLYFCNCLFHSVTCWVLSSKAVVSIVLLLRSVCISVSHFFTFWAL